MLFLFKKILFIKLIGLPMFPPYWSFGFQLSRWGYKNLSEVQNVIERTKNINLPHVNKNELNQKIEFQNNWLKKIFLGCSIH